MADIIQIRRDTAANWTNANPTLAQGEMGYETDTGKLKFGDGTTVWTGLSYYFGNSNFLESGDNISELNNNVGYTTNTGDVTLTGTQTLTNKTLTAPNLTNPSVTSGTITEDVYDVSLIGLEEHTLEPDNGSVQIHAMSNDMAYLDGFSSGEAITLLINTTNSDGIVWPTITWVNNGGIAPTIPVTGGPVTIALWKAGTTLYGALVGDGS